MTYLPLIQIFILSHLRVSFVYFPDSLNITYSDSIVSIYSHYMKIFTMSRLITFSLLC